MVKSFGRADRVIAFARRYLLVPEGPLVGQPITLLPFQERFIREIYDNPHGTRRAYLSVARRAGKTATLAIMMLAHIIGPEAKPNSRVASGARSRDQAALLFDYMVKMVRMSPELEALVRIIPSSKKIIGLARNVEYRALSADAGSNHGTGYAAVCLDEAGQIRGEYDAFTEAITTSMGTYDDALLFVISTQAATDSDWFSIQLDDAKHDPRTVCHLYTAPADCDLLDEEAWHAANPSLGVFRSMVDMRQQMEEAARMPSKEATARLYLLNQRVEATAPFVSKGVWLQNAEPPAPISGPVFAGLDLSEVADLTAFVAITPEGEREWGVHPTFWLPGDGLRERSKADRVPYDRWHASGHLLAAPGRTVDYAFVAAWIADFRSRHDLRRVGFDRWNMRHLRPWLEREGFTTAELEGDDAVFVGVGQGFQTMSPALRDLEANLLQGRYRHGAHPVLTMCATNAVVKMDPAGGRKLDKSKARGRIDGMVALAMAQSVAVDDRKQGGGSMDDYFASLATA